MCHLRNQEWFCGCITSILVGFPCDARRFFGTRCLWINPNFSAIAVRVAYPCPRCLDRNFAANRNAELLERTPLEAAALELRFDDAVQGEFIKLIDDTLKITDMLDHLYRELAVIRLGCASLQVLDQDLRADIESRIPLREHIFWPYFPQCAAFIRKIVRVNEELTQCRHKTLSGRGRSRAQQDQLVVEVYDLFEAAHAKLKEIHAALIDQPDQMHWDTRSLGTGHGTLGDMAAIEWVRLLPETAKALNAGSSLTEIAERLVHAPVEYDPSIWGYDYYETAGVSKLPRGPLVRIAPYEL